MYYKNGSGQEKENAIPTQTNVPSGPQSPNTINAVSILMVRLLRACSHLGNERS